MGRRPLKDAGGRGIKPYTVKLFEHQIAYLQEMGRGRASAWLRELIDRSIRAKKARSS